MMTYEIKNKEYEIFQAASGDYCVTVMEYGEEDLSYNLGSLEKAYAFILSEYQIKEVEG